MYWFPVLHIVTMIGIAPSPMDGTRPPVWHGCTAFCLVGPNSVAVGKNLDWDLATGLLVA